MLKITESKELKLTVLSLLFVSLALFASLFEQARTIVKYQDTSDFSAYFSAYTIKREFGSGIYNPQLFDDLEYEVPGNAREYLYSPVLAEFLSVVMPENYISARLIWLLLELSSIFLLIILVSAMAEKNLGIKRQNSIITVGFAFIGASFIDRGLYYGQISSLLACVFFGAIYLHYAKFPRLAAAIVGAISLIKIYTVVYIVALLIQRKYVESLFFCVGVSFVFLLSWACFGLDDWGDYLSFMHSGPLTERGLDVNTALQKLYEVPNYSPTSMLTLLSDQFGLGFTESQVWRLVLCLVFVVALFVFFLKYKTLVTMPFFNLLALGITGIFLVSPLLWNHNFVYIFPFVLLIALSRVNDDITKFSGTYLLCLTSLFLINFPDFLTNLGALNVGVLVIFKYTKLFGILLAVPLFFRCHVISTMNREKRL